MGNRQESSGGQTEKFRGTDNKVQFMEISGIGNSAKDRRKFYEECKEQFGVLTI